MVVIKYNFLKAICEARHGTPPGDFGALANAVALDMKASQHGAVQHVTQGTSRVQNAAF